MPNQIVALTYPQKLAMALQSRDQNALLPTPSLPSMGGGGGMGAMPDLGQMLALKKAMAQQGPAGPMTPGDMQAANLRDYEDMGWGK